MFSAITSLLIGTLTLITGAPAVLPILGLGLGVNGLLKEKKKELQVQKKGVKVISIIGMILCGIPVLFMLTSLAIR